MAAQRQRQGIETVEREREPAQPLGFHVIARRIRGGALVEALAVAGRGQRIGRGIARIERQRALEQRQRLGVGVVLLAVEQVEPARAAHS